MLTPIHKSKKVYLYRKIVYLGRDPLSDQECTVSSIHCGVNFYLQHFFLWKYQKHCDAASECDGKNTTYWSTPGFRHYAWSNYVCAYVVSCLYGKNSNVTWTHMTTGATNGVISWPEQICCNQSCSGQPMQGGQTLGYLICPVFIINFHGLDPHNLVFIIGGVVRWFSLKLQRWIKIAMPFDCYSLWLPLKQS